jgi:hypothetical protein
LRWERLAPGSTGNKGKEAYRGDPVHLQRTINRS